MPKVKSGGPAFPSQWDDKDNEGMSLRDWFAGQALVGLISGYATAYGSPTSQRWEIINEAYGFADEMIAASESGNA